MRPDARDASIRRSVTAGEPAGCADRAAASRVLGRCSAEFVAVRVAHGGEVDGAGLAVLRPWRILDRDAAVRDRDVRELPQLFLASCTKPMVAPLATLAGLPSIGSLTQKRAAVGR